MKCPKCGFENLEEANFCIKCGHRIDGKIPCPKCQEYIPNDAEHCPHCGKAIPHQKANNEQAELEEKTRRDSISNVFNFVSCFVTLFLFILAISSTFLSHFLDYFGNPLIDFLPTSSFLSEFNASSGTIKARLLVGLIICAIDFIVCLVFSTIGVVKTSKAFKNKSLIFDSYKYLAIVIASKIVTFSLLKMNCYAPANYESSSNSTFIWLSICHLSVCIAFDCFLKFKKDAVSIFIARIILGVGLILPVLLLSSIGESYVYYYDAVQDCYINKGLIEHFTDLTGRLIVNGATPELVSSYAVCSISMIFMISIISLTYSFLIYYIVSYFRGMNKFRKFRIAFYMSNIILSIFATIYFVSSVVEYYLFRNYVGNSSYGGYGEGPIWVLIISALLVGVAIATFNIYNRASKRAKLAEKTTKVE